MPDPSPLDEALGTLRGAVTAAEAALGDLETSGADLTDQLGAAAKVHAARSALARFGALQGGKPGQHAGTDTLSALFTSTTDDQKDDLS